MYDKWYGCGEDQVGIEQLGWVEGWPGNDSGGDRFFQKITNRTGRVSLCEGANWDPEEPLRLVTLVVQRRDMGQGLTD